MLIFFLLLLFLLLLLLHFLLLLLLLLEFHLLLWNFEFYFTNGEAKIGGEIYLPLAVSLPQWPQWPGLLQNQQPGALCGSAMGVAGAQVPLLAAFPGDMSSNPHCKRRPWDSDTKV